MTKQPTIECEDLTQVRRKLLDAALLCGDFVLSSGARRDCYLDKCRFETRPALLRSLAERLADLATRWCRPARRNGARGGRLGDGGLPLEWAALLDCPQGKLIDGELPPGWDGPHPSRRRR